MIPAWVAKYVGLEYEDRGRGPRHDCWSLCRLVWREQFGLALPSYVERYATSTDAEEVAALVRGELGPWLPVLPLDNAREGDALLIRMRGVPMHVGIVVAPGYFLHVAKGVNACVERYDSLAWNRRIVGLFRHKELLWSA